MRLTKIVAISSAFALVTALGMQGASALVWTDQADYSPGSVVTIHGDNSDGAAYVDGESVAVSVLGPNGYTAECMATVASGTWSCDITLWDSLDAVGAYTYTATGQTSGVTETGSFSDGPAYDVAFQVNATGLPSGDSLSLSIPVSYSANPLGGAASGTLTATNATNSTNANSVHALPSSTFTYSGFVATLIHGAYTCTRGAEPSPASPFTTGVGGGNVRFVVTYSCALTTPADSTAPVISYALTGTPGSNGWYTSNVFVDWTVTDAESAAVIDSGCTDATLSAETAGTTLTCTAHSLGGSASDSVTLKIDKTGPSASLSVSAGTLGDNGWYTSDVTVSTSGSDSISGPVLCTADQYQTTNTSGTAFAGSCTNNAGLTTSASALTVKLDKDGPSASLSVTAGTPGANGWYTSDVTVHTSGSDPSSSPVTCTVDQQQTSETAGTVFNGSCTNAAGITTNAEPLTIKLDKTGPTAALAVTAGTLGSNGWYTSDLTLSTSGSDGVSGGVTCTPDQTLSTETTGLDFNGSCTNAAGLSTDADTLNVKLDKTGPSANLAVTAGTAGANGWYTSDVTVGTSGSDGISGGVTCSIDQYQTTETADTLFYGTCTNAAGLSSNATAIHVKLDKTGPTASLAVTAGTAGANGWYTSDVTVSTTGGDTISSPVTCTAAQYQTDETSGTVFNGSCTNDAGLTTAAAGLTIKLDESGPSAELSVTAGTPGANGWYTSNVTVGTTGNDGISSPVTCTADQYQTTETTGTTFNGSCTNDAGLTTNATALIVKLDKTGPTANLAVTAGTLGSNSWYTSDVTVGTSGSDSISAPVTCTAAQYQTTETTGATFNGSCTNDAGLTTNATALTVKLDKTSPVITWNADAPTDGGNYYFGDLPLTTGCSALDAISLVTAAGCVIGGYDTTVGSHTAVATASNYAGLSSFETHTYTVNPWTLTGFYAPVDMRFVWNVVKAGSTVPLKFEVFKGTTELTTKGQIVQGPTEGFTITKDPTDAPPTVTNVPVPVSMLTSGKTQLRYDATSGQFIQNWQTPKAPGYYKVTLTTKDGSTLVAWFQLK